MFRSSCPPLRYGSAIALCLFLPLQATAQSSPAWPPLFELSFVELHDLASGGGYSHSHLKSLKSQVERERTEQIEVSNKDKKRLKKQLDSARKQLHDLNKSKSSDTAEMAEKRVNLHRQVETSEEAIRKNEAERQQILATAEIKLAKLKLAEEWPGRREQIRREVEQGQARDRKRGDVDDIGHRKLVKNQEEDIAIGEMGVRQMISSGLIPGAVQDNDIQQYIRDLTGKIARNSDLKIPLHAAVLESPDIYVSTLPGGFMFVTSGLIRSAETEAQLAGVLSREIARMATRQGTRASKRSIYSTVFATALQITAGFATGGITSMPAYYGINAGAQGISLLMDRALVPSKEKFQKEADQLGIQYAWKAGFDPAGFVSFLDKLARDKQYATKTNFFHTELALGDRVIGAFSEIQYLTPRESRVVDSAQFQRTRQALEEYGAGSHN
jgi:peptidase M48-like protein